MTQLIKFFAGLYPRWWRNRYGREFDALLEGTGGGMRIALNVLCGFFVMQLRTWLTGRGYEDRQIQIIQMLIKNRWLLALCGLLDAIISAVYLVGAYADGPLAFHVWRETVVFLGRLTLAAGLCTVVTATLNSGKNIYWLLLLNGLACIALGATFTFWRGPLAFRTVALLMIVLAVSTGTHELTTARSLRQHVADKRLLSLAGLASLVFAWDSWLSYFIGSNWSPAHQLKVSIG